VVLLVNGKKKVNLNLGKRMFIELLLN